VLGVLRRCGEEVRAHSWWWFPVTRPLRENYVFCMDCWELTLHDADLLSPVRAGEPVLVALTCRECGHIANGGERWR